MADKRKKKDYKFVLEAQILSALRRIFMRSPMFQVVKQESREKYVAKKKDGSDSSATRYRYKCACCGEYNPEKGPIRLKNGKMKKNAVLMALDHIQPVISTDGLTRTAFGKMDWNIVVDRMFAGITFWDTSTHTFFDIPPGRFQMLCRECHLEKSNKENKLRRDSRKEEKRAKIDTSPKKGSDNENTRNLVRNNKGRR